MQDKINLNWWNRNKRKLGLPPAIIFWLVSGLCFVFGLSFQNPIGITLWDMDISMWIAIGLAIANTMIQIIGNDREAEDMGIALWVGWMASYVLGIGSNINAIMQILHMESYWLELSIAASLGAMIEVLPERLVVDFLKSLEIPKKKEEQPPQQKNNNQNYGKLPKQQIQEYENIPEFLKNRGNGNPHYQKQQHRR